MTDDIMDAEFNIWWQVYPRKIAKGAARTAYRRARTKTDAETLLGGVNRFASDCATKDPRYICHASTWLNGERWEDEPGHQKGSRGALDEPLIGGFTRTLWGTIFQLYRATGLWRAGGSGPPGTLSYLGPYDLLSQKEREEYERAVQKNGVSKRQPEDPGV